MNIIFVIAWEDDWCCHLPFYSSARHPPLPWPKWHSAVSHRYHSYPVYPTISHSHFLKTSKSVRENQIRELWSFKFGTKVQVPVFPLRIIQSDIWAKQFPLAFLKDGEIKIGRHSTNREFGPEFESPHFAKTLRETASLKYRLQVQKISRRGSRSRSRFWNSTTPGFDLRGHSNRPSRRLVMYIGKSDP